jgi:hypothetical protein
MRWGVAVLAVADARSVPPSRGGDLRADGFVPGSSAQHPQAHKETGMDINTKAQEAFRRVLRAYFVTGSWIPEVVADYVKAERAVDHEEAVASGTCECDDCTERVAALWARSA